MPVYQVEQYYVHISGLSITSVVKNNIEQHLSDGGYSEYVFTDEDATLVIDDVYDEDEGERLERQINAISGRG